MGRCSHWWKTWRLTAVDAVYLNLEKKIKKNVFFKNINFSHYNAIVASTSSAQTPDATQKIKPRKFIYT